MKEAFGAGLQQGVAVSDAPAVRQTGHFGNDVIVRHIIGLDPGQRGIAVAEPVTPGTQLVFCQRNAQAAKADLIRICAASGTRHRRRHLRELCRARRAALWGAERRAANHPPCLG